MKKYILRDKIPVEIDEISEWGRWIEGLQNRIVAKDMIGKVKVSTVFLGIDHGFGDGPPILFETMIFGGEHDDYQERYSTWEQAEEGHKRAVRLVKEEQ